MKRSTFLRNSLALLTPTVISGNPIHILDHHAVIDTKALEAVNNDRVLVIIQLNGGNDGLNTVLPIDQYDKYYTARTNIAIPEKKILGLNGFNATGLHPSMTAMQRLFNEGQLDIVQSVGYPQPNFSHFRATDIWMSGSDSNEYINTGWVGRFLDANYPGYPDNYPNDKDTDPLAIQIGSITSLTCQGPMVNMGMSISDPNAFYNLLENADQAVPNTNAGYELSFIRRISKQTNKYAARIKAASDAVSQQTTYPNTSLANQLKIVARLIKGGLKTKIYLVNYGGFDTHAGQVVATDTITGTHANLLGAVSEAIGAFQNDIKNQAIEDRVIGMTYSEFGRRIKSNASGGTDHGAAAPLFLFGKNVRGGVFGENPTIPSSVTVSDNVPYQHDFRTVYNSILKYWFCVNEADNKQIMLKDFPSLNLINASACAVATENPVFEKNANIVAYPNPFNNQTRVEFKTDGGHTLVQLLDTTGAVIRVLVDRVFSYAGMNSVTLSGAALQAGVYYIRIQNGVNQHVKTIIKL
ncbi:MAG: hypothetical protein RIT38_1179 [Bacteroidota bacterium]|jgi:uncharacterized protein (DUF1501 family)